MKKQLKELIKKKGYYFNSYNINTYAPSSAGIYTFWHKKNCIYVGRSNNIKKRIKEHYVSCHNDYLSLWLNTYTRCIVVKYIKLEDFPSNMVLSKIESKFILYLNPNTNFKYLR